MRRENTGTHDTLFHVVRVARSLEERHRDCLHAGKQVEPRQIVDEVERPVLAPKVDGGQGRDDDGPAEFFAEEEKVDEGEELVRLPVRSRRKSA